MSLVSRSLTLPACFDECFSHGQTQPLGAARHDEHFPCYIKIGEPFLAHVFIYRGLVVFVRVRTWLWTGGIGGPHLLFFARGVNGPHGCESGEGAFVGGRLGDAGAEARPRCETQSPRRRVHFARAIVQVIGGQYGLGEKIGDPGKTNCLGFKSRSYTLFSKMVFS